MNSHLDNLSFYVPDIRVRRLLDLGSGKGRFLIEATKKGMDASGLEYFGEYIKKSLEEAEKQGVVIKVTQGKGEDLPYKDKAFGFVNMSEVIEHVEDPHQVMREVYRVLDIGGRAYVSVPNRYGMIDQHFHLFGINWMPRSWAHIVLTLFKRHRNYAKDAGCQSLTEMHYYTYRSVRNLMESIGFSVVDAREEKIKRKFGWKKVFLLPIYKIARIFYFDSCHLILSKS